MLKYQVFVSCTDDVIEERQEVMKALLELDCFPVGMTLSKTIDNDYWALIQELIEDSDYYIIIVGSKYGNLHPSGSSYTEMEFLSAQKCCIPISVFLRYSENLPSDNEESAENIVKFKKFKNLLQIEHLNTWKFASDLGGEISRRLIRLKKKNPRLGWVKADRIADEEAVKKIISLTEEIDLLENEKLMNSPGHVRSREYYENVINSLSRSNFGFNQQPPIYIQTGGNNNPKNYIAEQSPNALFGDNNTYENNSDNSDHSKIIISTVKKRFEQAGRIDELIKLILQEKEINEQQRQTLIANFDNIKEEIIEESPNKSRLFKWLLTTKKILENVVLSHHTVEAIKWIYENLNFIVHQLPI